MDFEWDPAKAEANLRKHGIAGLKAAEVFLDLARLERPDVSDERDEDRWQVIGRVESYILFVVFTQRNDRIRLRSARKANRNERKIYWIGHISS